MSLSIRAQILAAAFCLFIPAVLVMAWAAGATYEEQQMALREAARENAALLVLRLADDPTGIRTDVIVTESLDALPPLSQVAVTDADGRLIAGAIPAEIDVFCPGTTPLPAGRGAVTVYLPEQLAWERTWSIYRRNYLVVVTVTVLVVVIVFFLSRRWRRGLRALEEHALRIGAGDRRDGAPVRMPSSEMVSLQESLMDMEQNLVSLERQIVRQERLAAIGTLMSGIAHELNNPLQAIAGRAQLLMRDTSVSDLAKTDLDLIQRESARASVIIRNLSRFSRQGDVAPEPILLGAVVASVVELRQRRIEELGIHLVVDDASRARVMGVLPEFQQVLLNFVVNAEQAMASMKRGQRMLTIRTRDVDDRAYCEVEDTGPGVSPNDEPKLFQPFFTTKPVGEGTGLGLSVSHGIIESYGGRIGYRRADAGGAIMWFDVPAVS